MFIRVTRGLREWRTRNRVMSLRGRSCSACFRGPKQSPVELGIASTEEHRLAMTRKRIMATENLVYDRPEGFTDTPTHYCPGCTHGVAHRLVAEVLEEMGVIDRTIGVAPVGCAVFAYNYFDIDFVYFPHVLS